jgi:YfiH family protein
MGQARVLGVEDRLVTMNQTHSVRIVQADHSGQIDADGCFTLKPNLALSVRVADCVPIFLWSGDGSLIGIVHAGWRGTLSKIALRFPEAVGKEVSIRSTDLLFSLGPSIGKCCYKVGQEVLEQFRITWSNAEDFFHRSTKGLYLDLRAANRFLLSSVGAKESGSLDLCTFCNRTRFYSYRHQPGQGRNWGFICRESS